MLKNLNSSELLQQLLRLSPYYRSAFALTIVGTFFALSPTIVMMQVYDRVLNSRNVNTLAMLLIAAFFVYLFMEVIEYLRARIMQEAGLELDAALRERIFDAIFDGTLRRVPSSGQQALNELRSIRVFLSSPAMLAIMDAPASLIFLVFIFLIDTQLGAFSLVGAVLQAVLGYISEKQTKGPIEDAQMAMMYSQGYAGGALQNAPLAESMGFRGALLKKWLQLQNIFIERQATASYLAGGAAAASKFVQVTQGSMVMALGCYLTISGHLPGGGVMMIVASILSGRALQPLVQLIGMWKMVSTTRDSYARLDAFLSAQPPRMSQMPLPAPSGTLTVEGLFAGAPGGKPGSQIIRGVNFRLDAGQSLAIIGPSGSGKTTLSRLLVGLWPASVGSVRLDGADIFARDKAEVGKYIGYLPQGVDLFDGSIAENIARFGRVDMDLVQSAAKCAGIYEFVVGLPDGFDTQVGFLGSALSGGERQRVAIARAIYGNPRLVVLDEPDSNLDTDGDKALVNVISSMKQAGSTIVVITHRKNLLNELSFLLVLVDGAARQYGPTQEVLGRMSSPT